MVVRVEPLQGAARFPGMKRFGWLVAAISFIALTGCTSSATTPGHFQFPCNTGTVQQLANPLPSQGGVATTIGQVTIVAMGGSNVLHSTPNQWIVTLNDNTGMVWTGTPLTPVSDASGPHPYPSDFYYASNFPMLNASRTYRAVLSQPTGTCTPISLGGFST